MQLFLDKWEVITCVCCEPAHKIKHLLPTCMRHLLLDMYVPTAKSAKNDHTLVKTIITNYVCIIQVATIYSAIFDMVIIYTLQVCRKFIILLCSQEENYFFHPCSVMPWSNESKSCMRVDKNWQTKVCMRVFSTLMRWSNENKSCMRVDKNWQTKVCMRVFSTLMPWSNENKSFIRVGESWQARVCIRVFSNNLIIKFFL